MKPADKAFLDGLRKSVCDHIPQDHWDLVVKAVTDAGDIRDVTGYARTIILQGVEKGRFSSRSEAGRYAANMRWRGNVPKGGLATAEARQEANAKAGKGSGNPARGGNSFVPEGLNMGSGKNDRVGLADGSNSAADYTPAKEGKKPKTTEEVDEKTATAIKDADLSDLSSMIRRDLRSQGKKIPFGAEPYLDALSSLSDANQNYGMDSGKSMIAYALSNLTSYKGPKARAIKAELKARMKAATETPYSERNLDNVDFSKATFSSRSEAGRYAANMRWKGQGKTTATTDGAGNTQRSRDAIAHWEGIRSKAEEAQHRAADNGQGEEVGRLQGVIDRADHELAIERETILPKGQPTSEEAQTKQAFIDAQKERLGRMGRGTSQIAHMALEAGIKQLEAELASGDTSEARNRPGQFFDDRAGAKGEKYIGSRPNKEVAVDIRRDLKSAQESGELPAGLKFSVKMGSGGSSITVTVKGISNPRVRDDLGRDVTSPEAKAVYDKVDRITNAYNRDNSDMMTDYFDTDYYGFVNIEG